VRLLRSGAANHRGVATAAALSAVPNSGAARLTLCVADRWTALALPRAHYYLRARARSGSTDPVFLPRSHDDRRANSLDCCGSCLLSRPDTIRRPPYPTLARILLADYVAITTSGPAAASSETMSGFAAASVIT
jgi:hypothetical protein